MEYLLSNIIKDPKSIDIMSESGYLVYRIHKIDSEWNKDNYIGDTKDTIMNRMFNGFFGHLNMNAKNSQAKLRNAVLKYGLDKFSLEIIYKGEYIDWIEELFITMHDSYENGYNMNRSGKGSGGITSEMVIEQWSRLTDEQKSDRCRKSNIVALERGTHPFQVPGHQENAGHHSHDNMTHEQNVEIGIKSAKTRLQNDPDHLTYKKAYESSMRSNDGIHPTQGYFIEFKLTDPEGYRKFQSEKMKKVAMTRSINGTQKVKWVYHNPTTDEYIVKCSNWVHRYKKGFSEKLFKYTSENWNEYCKENNIDINLLPDQ